uniref:hypothetical protein n=1 Tax=Rhodococcus sp. H36-A4 TaxID=3004353 RepID=UPI003FA70C9B
MTEFTATATEAISPGKHQIRAEFAYDGGGLAKGGTVTVFYDGREVGNGRVDQTQPMVFSADETTDVGDDDDHSHVIDPADIARVAVSRQ